MRENSFEIKTESIVERREIIAPPNFVSVFHETEPEYIPLIDKGGLKPNSETKKFGKWKANITQRTNDFLDELRPEELKIEGISRRNIFAYPFLEYGHGLNGAVKRFQKPNIHHIKSDFELYQSHKMGYTADEFLKAEEGGNREYFFKKYPNEFNEYFKKVTDPEYLKQKHPGEVLELKVDPQKCYVGDIDRFTEFVEQIPKDADLVNMKLTDLTEDESVYGEIYWNNIITLENFLKWYKKEVMEGTVYGDYIKNKDAPENLPDIISNPEILIPESIPQNHIKLVR